MRRQSAQAKRNEKALKRIKEAQAMSQEELEAFLQWLTKNGMEFHLDDNPADIDWSPQPSAAQLAHLHTTHAAMWRHFTSDQIWEAAGRLWNIGGCDVN